MEVFAGTVRYQELIKVGTQLIPYQLHVHCMDMYVHLHVYALSYHQHEYIHVRVHVYHSFICVYQLWLQ